MSNRNSSFRVWLFVAHYAVMEDRGQIATPEDRPVLSVVVPVRNGGEPFRACLRALRGSEFRDLELIVVDDASSDDSAAIAVPLGARVIQLAARVGPASARNLGAEAARGEYLCFVDADVCVHRDTLGALVETLRRDPSIDALFGSYDARPAAPNFLSQYKNLFHHFVHQQASPEATTFWTGCGAIRRAVFVAAGGFDASFRRPCIEDIELGARIVLRGHRIVLRRDVQVTHLKRWTLWSMVRSDVFDRGIPWTELLLREGRLPNDLNLRFSQRLSALLACAFAALLVGGASRAAGCALLMLIVLNHEFYRFFARERGWWFAVRVAPLHVLYFLYSTAAFGIGWLRHALRAAHATTGSLISPRKVLRSARAALQTGRTVL